MTRLCKLVVWGADKFDVQINSQVFITNHVRPLVAPQHEETVSSVVQDDACAS